MMSHQIVKMCNDIGIRLDTTSALDGQTEGNAKTLLHSACTTCRRTRKSMFLLTDSNIFSLLQHVNSALEADAAMRYINLRLTLTLT